MNDTSIFHIAFPDEKDKSQKENLTEDNFKSLYPEFFLTKVSKSRRRRLVSTTQKKSPYFDSFAYIQASRNHKKNVREGYIDSKLYKVMKKILFKIGDIVFLNEKRITADAYTILNSNYFDKEWYKNKNSLALDDVELAKHYLLIGFTELLDPSPRFSTKFYLKNNPDIVYSNANPLLHYLIHGISERRKISEA